jgi:Domain of unknown function (DUF4412)
MSALLLVVLAAAPGTFEGELAFALTTQGGGGGTVMLSLSPRGLRSDVDGAFVGRRLKASVLVRAGEPDVGIALDPVKKTAQRFSLATASEAMRPQQSKVWRVEKLGTAKVLDFPCDHVRVADDGGFFAEYWVSNALVLEDGLAAMVNRAAKQPASVEAELRRAGIHGLVLKMVQHSGADTVTLELTRATPKLITAEVLALDGYTETPGALGGSANLSQVAQFNQLSDEQKQAVTRQLQENWKKAEGK